MQLPALCVETSLRLTAPPPARDTAAFVTQQTALFPPNRVENTDTSLNAEWFLFFPHFCVISYISQDK